MMCFCMYSMCGWQGFDKVKIGTDRTDFKKVIDFHEEIFNLNTYDLEHNRLFFFFIMSVVYVNKLLHVACTQIWPFTIPDLFLLACLLIFDLVRPGFQASTLLGLSLFA